MGEFSSDWLSAREPADHRARSQRLTQLVVDRVVARAGGASSTSAALSTAPVTVLDLGAGTGSNARFLVRQLPRPQHWTLVDRDADLLGELTKQMAAWSLDRGAVVSGSSGVVSARGPEGDWHFATHVADLACLVDQKAAPTFDRLFAAPSLITASALLDLVSQRWLEALVERCRQAGAAVLFVLTYDGRLTCAPSDPDDELVRSLVNRHQQSTKGFGRALGPTAAGVAAQCLAAAGYTVEFEPSDWSIGPDEPRLLRPLLEGWTEAAAEIQPSDAERLRAWLARRLALMERGDLRVEVGHRDLAAWPAG